jgi:hypothetical protein
MVEFAKSDINDIDNFYKSSLKSGVDRGNTMDPERDNK